MKHMSTNLTQTDFPSFQTGDWGILKMPTIILLPSPAPPFEMDKTESKKTLHTLTFDYRIINYELRINNGL
jgi:hypothetical protein